jgi:hypothetical protein
MGLLELTVHANLKPRASAGQTVDLPQVAVCPRPAARESKVPAHPGNAWLRHDPMHDPEFHGFDNPAQLWLNS